MKINRGYWSIEDYLINEPNTQGDVRYNPKNQSQLLGSLQPMVDLGRIFTATIKPYKSPTYLRDDILRPLLSMGYVLGGLFYVVAAPILFLSMHLASAIGKTIKKPPSLAQMVSWVTVGVLSMISGMVQTAFAFTPFFWLRIPLRLGITYFKKDKMGTFEQQSSVQELLKSPEKSVANTTDICLELHRKYLSAVSKDNLTNVPVEEEERRYRRINIVIEGKRLLPPRNSCESYLELFKEAAQMPANLEETPLVMNGIFTSY